MTSPKQSKDVDSSQDKSITRYKLFSADNHDGFIQNVNNAIDAGWELYGTPFVRTDTSSRGDHSMKHSIISTHHVYSQAMIKVTDLQLKDSEAKNG